MTSTSPVTVNISGAVFSILFYGHKTAGRDQEGLLLGEVVSCVSDTISDLDGESQKEEIHINVHSFAASNQQTRFYDGQGHIDPVKLSEVSCGQGSSVVGWYRARHNSTLRASMREMAVHLKLLELLPAQQSKFFLFALITSHTEHGRSLHNSDYSFMQWNQGIFRSVGVNVVNLGDTSHSEYILHPSHVVSQSSGMYHASMNAYRSKLLNKDGLPSGVASTHQFNESLYKKLSSLGDQVATSEEQIGAIEQSIAEIKQRLKIAKREASHSDAGDSPEDDEEEVEVQHQHPQDYVAALNTSSSGKPSASNAATSTTVFLPARFTGSGDATDRPPDYEQVLIDSRPNEPLLIDMEDNDDEDELLHPSPAGLLFDTAASTSTQAPRLALVPSPDIEEISCHPQEACGKSSDPFASLVTDVKTSLTASTKAVGRGTADISEKITDKTSPHVSPASHDKRSTQMQQQSKVREKVSCETVTIAASDKLARPALRHERLQKRTENDDYEAPSTRARRKQDDAMAKNGSGSTKQKSGRKRKEPPNRTQNHNKPETLKDVRIAADKRP